MPWHDRAVTKLPKGFKAHVANIGIKDGTDDFCLVVCDDTAAASGVFTQSRFAGPSVTISRQSSSSSEGERSSCMKSFIASAMYSGCSVGMVLVNKSLASRFVSPLRLDVIVPRPISLLFYS